MDNVWIEWHTHSNCCWTGYWNREIEQKNSSFTNDKENSSRWTEWEKSQIHLNDEIRKIYNDRCIDAEAKPNRQKKNRNKQNPLYNHYH